MILLCLGQGFSIDIGPYGLSIGTPIDNPDNSSPSATKFSAFLCGTLR